MSAQDTANFMARIHAAAFTTPRPWSEAEFRDLLSSPHVFYTAHSDAFALGRVVADEVELLTIATDPSQRKQGLARRCLQDFDRIAEARGATRAFLEVAITNTPAIALYTHSGWQITGRRPAYYTAPDGTRVDAQIMGKALG